MSLANLRWTLPPEDAADATKVDVFDNGTQIGSADATPVNEFSSGELDPGDHVFTLIVRSRAGAAFDSDPSNVATIAVPAAPVKLTAISDLTATLANVS